MRIKIERGLCRERINEINKRKKGRREEERKEEKIIKKRGITEQEDKWKN